MSVAAMLLASLRFAVWEIALFFAAARLAARIPGRNRRPLVEQWLAILAIEITLESTLAAGFSFFRINSPASYWIAAALLLVLAARLTAPGRNLLPTVSWRHPDAALMAGFTAPLLLLAFKPVEEIDSINYLHYLLEWMGNRATPYTFATNYVAFWELSFLPAWVVTRVDLFFPVLALKSVVLLGLAGWLLGREWGLRGRLLAWAIFGALVMRHFWFEYSGVPTLKNDALHGAGFALMLLAVSRAGRRRLDPLDVAWLAFGAAFGAVKYTGLFLAAIAFILIVLLRRPKLPTLALSTVLFLATSGHYYLHNWLLYGSPFYPFQINIGPIHLPGTADLSNTSILYSLRDARLWRVLFWPAGGISPAGLLFPLIVAAVLPVALWRALRRGWSRIDWSAVFLLCGWLLYFRSVYSASASAGDLAFLINNLNSVRYVDGVLAASELFLLARLTRYRWLAWTLLATHAASRLWILYAKLPLDVFPAAAIVCVSIAAMLLWAALPRRAAIAAAVILLFAGPLAVDRNRTHWTAYWNDLKPAIAAVRGPRLVEVALPDGGYFAGQVVTAGNPVDPQVRSLLPEEISELPEKNRPHYLAVLPTPGSEVSREWRARYGEQIRSWGYRPITEGGMGALFEKQ